MGRSNLTKPSLREATNDKLKLLNLSLKEKYEGKIYEKVGFDSSPTRRVSKLTKDTELEKLY